MASCTSALARSDALSFFMTVLEPGRAQRARAHYLLYSTPSVRWTGRPGGDRRFGSRRRLPAARDAFQPFDLLDVRHEHGLRRVLGELRPDRVRLRGDEREPLTANEVRSLDAFQERAGLVGHGLPAERVVLQLADFVERLPDRLRHVVEHADDVDRRLDDGLRLVRRRCWTSLRCSFVNGATSSICDRMVRNCAMTASAVRVMAGRGSTEQRC